MLFPSDDSFWTMVHLRRDMDYVIPAGYWAVSFLHYGRQLHRQGYEKGLKDQAENFWGQLPDHVTDSLVIRELE